MGRFQSFAVPIYHPWMAILQKTSGLPMCKFNAHCAVQTGHSSEGHFSFSWASLPIFCSHVNALWVYRILVPLLNCLYSDALQIRKVHTMPLPCIFASHLCSMMRTLYCGLVRFQKHTWWQYVLFPHGMAENWIFYLSLIFIEEAIWLPPPVVSASVSKVLASNF